MGFLLKVAAASKAVWDWLKTPWGQATTSVLIERFQHHGDRQAVEAAKASAQAADESPATGHGSLAALPASQIAWLEEAERGLLERIRVLTARLSVLGDRAGATRHLVNLAERLAWVQQRLAKKAA